MPASSASGRRRRAPVLGPVVGIVGGGRRPAAARRALTSASRQTKSIASSSALADLVLDPRAEVVRRSAWRNGISRASRGARTPSGTGVRPKAEKNGAGSQVLSSSSIRSWSGVSGKPGSAVKHARQPVARARSARVPCADAPSAHRRGRCGRAAPPSSRRRGRRHRSCASRSPSRLERPGEALRDLLDRHGLQLLPAAADHRHHR